MNRPYQFTQDWFSKHVGNWSHWFHDYKGKPGFQYLEVGVHEGRSLIWVLENIATHESARVVGIDLFADSSVFDRCKQNVVISGVSEKAKVIQGFSYMSMVGMERNSFDVIYLDADHNPQVVLPDAIAAIP